MEEVPRRTSFAPLASPLSSNLFNRDGNGRAFRLPGEGGDHLHCTVEPSPGHIRCRFFRLLSLGVTDSGSGGPRLLWRDSF